MVKKYDTVIVAVIALGLDFDQVKRGRRKIAKWKDVQERKDAHGTA